MAGAFRLAPLRHRSFRRLFLSQLVSSVGDSFNLVALPFVVLSTGHSIAAVGTVFAARSFTQVLFTALGGIVADRLTLIPIMQVTDWIRATTQVVAGLLVLTGQATIWELAALFAVYGAASAFFFPASRAVLPTVIELDLMQPANALSSVMFSLSGLVGPLLAGALLIVVSPAFALLVDSASFVLSGLLITGLGVRREASTRSASLREDARLGLEVVRRTRWLLVGLVHAAVFQVLVIGALTVLGPALALDQYDGARSWAVLLAATGAGGLLGGALAYRGLPSRPLLVVYSVLLATVGPVFIAMGVRAPFFLVLVLMALYGGGLTMADTIWHTTLQSFVPRHALGRVAALDVMVSTALRPVGLALIGPLGLWLGLRPTLVGVGITVSLVTAVVLASRAVRTMLAANAPTDAGLAAQPS